MVMRLTDEGNPYIPKRPNHSTRKGGCKNNSPARRLRSGPARCCAGSVQTKSWHKTHKVAL
uniref:Uncharacterized protein n=1 Tax=uncultured marine virus TaxID=186617 RepID=A0A0F7L2U2_9VIRU|nr:hypothetical protein [uncultured marine virus]